MSSLLQHIIRTFRGSSIVPAGSSGASAVGGPLSPTMSVPEGAEVATIAAGCFWGVEHIYRKYFANGKGLLDARVGYSGGTTSSPNYREVCSDTTGHAEALQIVFDPKLVSYETLIDFFFRMHDPTTVNRQGPDRGGQYRSAIFYHSDEQRQIAEDVKQRLQKTFYTSDPIATQIVAVENFWDAETYHQLYLVKNPYGYECPTHYLRTTPN
ncbi:peptide methionine sulfoxide reductase MsrA [Lipomyces tetrasporus]|uniref:peptide-methionine (S)-S-oxide reductase n=1 Tax=Lipomyces tetrasporus TaxID=54092 RepID=A0AAD7QWL6_9ASCO|nr:peptide methionine sulfoxide reductase MsrA [Lipomyces tetrasporus]KAJ8102630.1 peptide methionine sulfoxide reductase MsrA [Lipomyces tetrasporus]